MMRALALAAVLSGCTTLQYVEETDAIRLTGSIGAGDIREAGLQYNRLLERGLPIVWDGPMVSADAFYAPAAVKVSKGCYTANATWHPHAASSFGLFPRRDATHFLVDEVLPEPLRSAFKGTWHYWDFVTVALYSNSDLRELWPEAACKGE